MLSLFVYGTLKRGQRSHERFCSAATHIEPAWTWGRLYDLPQGYPMLQVPPELILALGSADRAADVTRLAGDARGLLDAMPPRFESAAWRRIEGEWITLAAESQRLAALDAWEGFQPPAARHYERVVVPIFTADEGVHLAWTYVAPDGKLPPDAMDCGERWPR